MAELNSFAEEACAYIEGNDIVKEKTQTLAGKITKEMTDIHISMMMLKELRRKSIRQRHWQMIFKELGL
jgi:hypothetical protein